MINQKELLTLAVRNNADWCALICTSHGVSVGWEPPVWYCAGPPPVFYPHIISIGPECDLPMIARKIPDMKGRVSIKDAYDSLALESLGFKRLFRGRWLVAPSQALAPSAYEFITTPDGLSHWQNAWNNGAEHQLFKAELLENPDVRFIAIFEGGELVSGAAANRSGPVAGITNFFCNSGDMRVSYSACIAAARSAWPVQEVVTYEREQNLATLEAMGMKELGALSVYQE